MKIAVLTEIINSHSGARAPLEIAKKLSNFGKEVVIFGYEQNSDPRDEKELTKAKVSIVKFPKPKSWLTKKIIPNLSLISHLRSQKPDIALFAGSFPFFVAALLARIPIIRIYMGTQFDAYLEKKLPDQKPNSLEKILNLVGNVYTYLSEFAILHLSNFVVAISKFAAYEVESLYKKKVDKVIYLGADHFPNPVSIASDQKQIKLLTVSRITPYKGFHILIPLVKKLHKKYKIKFTIAGSSPQKNYLKFLKKMAGNDISFVLNPGDSQLAKLYQDANIYITADRYLFFGFPVVEAAFFSKPSIAFNFAAASEIIDHGKSGYVANTPKEFLNKLEVLIKSTSLSSKMGKEAKIKSEKEFSWQNIALQYSEFIMAIK